MLALIDADVLLYQMGGLSNDEGHPLAWNLVKLKVDERIYHIMEGAGCNEYKLFLTGKSNFRIAEATILPYKGGRPSEKPYWHGDIKEYFLTSNKHGDRTTLSEYYEADDQLSIELCEDREKVRIEWSFEENHGIEISSYEDWYYGAAEVVLCTIDKDLDMCPGKHAKWGKDKKGKFGVTTYTVTQDEGTWWFYRQLITGDKSVDNILGLFGQGPVSAKKALKDVVDELDLYTIVQKKYEERFGNHWEMFMHETARLIWMLETPDQDIRVHLKEMESSRQAAIIQKQIEDEVI